MSNSRVRMLALTERINQLINQTINQSIPYAPYIVLLSLLGAIMRRLLLKRTINQRLSINQSIKRKEKQRQIDYVLQQSFDDFTNQSTNQPTDQSTTALSSESTNQPTNQSTLDYLSPLEREILSCTAIQLRDRIREALKLKQTNQSTNQSSKQSGSINHTVNFTCFNVMLAFIRQTIRVDRLCNAISEPMFEFALKHARELDAQPIDQSINQLMYGVPVSLKDSVGVAGFDCTLGVVAYANQPMPQHSLVVDVLLSQGAQIYVKSNVPQTLISFECKNPLFGVTRHWENAAYTPGGSSGGESVLLAGGASVLGVGTDIGGSVRIPSHFSGNYALKPTSRRISLMAFRPSVPGQETIPGIAGPMSQNMDDLLLLSEVLIHESSWKVDCDLIPRNLEVESIHRSLSDPTSKFRIGYWLDDGFLPASPACCRGVEIAVNALRSRGHTVELFQPYAILECIRLYYALLSADGAQTMTDQLKYEQYEDYTTALTSAVGIPTFIKQSVAYVLKNVVGDERASTLFGAARQSNVNALWKHQAAKKAWKTKFWQHVNDQRIDVLLSPCHLLPATKHGEYKAVSFTAAPTMIFNVLDAPAGVVPVTRVQSIDQWKPPINKISLLEKAVRKVYDVNQSINLPISVQVAARPFQEELVLRVMKEIDMQVGGIKRVVRE